MAITKQAKKAIRSSQNKMVVNIRVKRAMKEAMKTTKDTAMKNPKEAEKLLPSAYKAIDKAKKRGVIKKNTASRKKSRLAKFVQRQTV